MEYDSGPELATDDPPTKDISALLIKDYHVTGDHIDLREFYFSNQQYYREIEQLKKAHLQTMAELELMYRKKLDLKGVEELTECQKKFHACPASAHVRLPLYEDLQEHDEERRRLHREMEQQCLLTSQRPFSFLEHERLKKDQKEPKLYEQMLKHNKEEEERRKCPFKAKPVPCVVKEAALGEQQKEEELYRAIKMQMRARELLHSASMPPSMLAWQLSEKQVQKVAQDDEDTHQPKIYAELPDFDASYRKFWKLI